MKNLKLQTKSRDGLYEAEAIYNDGFVTVLKGSRVNMRANRGLKPESDYTHKRNDQTVVSEKGIMLLDVTFPSLSTAACFVTGRSANGMITWKTEDGRYVRYTLGQSDGEKVRKDKNKAVISQ